MRDACVLGPFRRAAHIAYGWLLLLGFLPLASACATGSASVSPAPAPEEPAPAAEEPDPEPEGTLKISNSLSAPICCVVVAAADDPAPARPLRDPIPPRRSTEVRLEPGSYEVRLEICDGPEALWTDVCSSELPDMDLRQRVEVRPAAHVIVHPPGRSLGPDRVSMPFAREAVTAEERDGEEEEAPLGEARPVECPARAPLESAETRALLRSVETICGGGVSRLTFRNTCRRDLEVELEHVSGETSRITAEGRGCTRIASGRVVRIQVGRSVEEACWDEAVVRLGCRGIVGVERVAAEP